MEDVWTGPRGQPLNMSFASTYMLEGSAYGEVIDSDRYSPNMGHPWVQSILSSMPTFRPVFRLCMEDSTQPNECFHSLLWMKTDSDGLLVEEEELISDLED